MATFPNGVAPSDDESYTKIKGVCNSNAEPVDKEKGVVLYCGKNGTPFQIYGCQCKAGYTLGDSSSCTGDIVACRQPQYSSAKPKGVTYVSMVQVCTILNPKAPPISQEAV